MAKMSLRCLVCALTLSLVQPQDSLDKQLSDLLWQELTQNNLHRQNVNQDSQSKTSWLLPQLLAKNPVIPNQPVGLSIPKDLVHPQVLPVLEDIGLIPGAPVPNDDTNVDKTEMHITVPTSNLTISSESKEKTAKQRIVNIAKSSMALTETQLNVIDKVHDKYKYNRLYKLGFVVCHLNKTREAVTDLMRTMQRNEDSWDVLQTLNAYEEIRKAKEFIVKALSTLKQFETQAPRVLALKGSDKERVGIAWSYYDDNL